MTSVADTVTGHVEKSPEAFRTISEVSEMLDLPQHVLRFWETRFTQVKPMKRGGGRRLYRPDHIALLRGIKALLYDDGMTIKGVQKVLREKGVKTVIARGTADASLTLTTPPDAAETARRLAALREKVSSERTVQEAEGAGKTTDADRIRSSISKLEALLAQLEDH